MTGLEKALLRVSAELEKARVPYMVIGGVANLVWGVPRATLDVDITVWVEPAAEAKTLERLCRTFKALTPDPAAFMSETRVLPLEVEGTKVDLVFGQLDYEREAVGRARPVEFAGKAVRVCAPEDLVVHKLLAERAKDTEDLRGLARRSGATLDRRLLDPLVKSLAVQLERPDIWERFIGLFGEPA